MIRKPMAFITFALAALALCGSALAAGGLTSPPPIYIPYGGKVVTEINLSDDDVLGLIKQAIPVIGEVLQETIQKTQGTTANIPPQIMALAGLDMTGLVEAIEGIRNVRLVVARYGGNPDPETLLKQFNDGVAKAGQFNKIASDFGFMPGMFALYAEAGNAGYMAVAYDASKRTMCAARVVGSLDVPRLIRWMGSAAQAIIPTVMPSTTDEHGERPGFDTAEPQAPDEPEADEQCEQTDESGD